MSSGSKRGLESESSPGPASKRGRVERSSSTTRDKKRRRKKARSVPLSSCPTPPSSSKSRQLLVSVSSDSEGDDSAPHLRVPPSQSNTKAPIPVEMGDVSESTTLTADSVNDEDLANEITRLKHELETKNKLIDAHQLQFAEIQQSLTCQICLDALYQPYAVVPCGHVSCFSCLRRWFTTSPDGDEIPPEFRIARPKTCPHCRARALQRPIELWEMKTMASSLARNGLAEGMEPPPQTAPATLNRDPWEGIFPSAESQRRQLEGLGRGMGFHDVEDNVWRCEDCQHEIMDGVCTGCNRVYADLDDLDEDYLPLYERDMDDDDFGFGLDMGGINPVDFHEWARDSSDEGEYESDFIDGEDDEDEVVIRPHVMRPRLHIDLMTDSEDEEYEPTPHADFEHTFRLSTPIRNPSPRPSVDESDEEEFPVIHRAARRATVVIDIDSDDDAESFTDNRYSPSPEREYDSHDAYSDPERADSDTESHNNWSEGEAVPEFEPDYEPDYESDRPRYHDEDDDDFY